MLAQLLMAPTEVPEESSAESNARFLGRRDKTLRNRTAEALVFGRLLKFTEEAAENM